MMPAKTRSAGLPKRSDIQLLARGRRLNLSTPRVMGVLNITPDSFSDGGRFTRTGEVDVDAVVRAAEQMVADGADMLDIGGESTRPGAAAVPEAVELARVIPVIERLTALDTLLSVDTRKAGVAAAALAAGCHLVNDVSGAEDDGMLATVAQHGAAVCLMHMQGEPAHMQNAPSYDSVVAEVRTYLEHRVRAALSAGVAEASIVVDPGIGFGKAQAHNLALLRSLPELAQGRPLLLGASRKSVVGHITGREVHERLAGSLALAVLAAERGAHILRVHDVRETRDALKVLEAFRALASPDGEAQEEQTEGS